MRVTWLCSRRVEGEIEGYYKEKQIESEKDRVKKELLAMMHQQTKWDVEYLKKSS